MIKIDVTMLPVGQGAMNLIEVYVVEGSSRWLYDLTLIDCGFQHTGPVRLNKLPIQDKKVVEYTVGKMRERSKLVDGIYLDNIIFTHRDTDHWILFDNLWEELYGGNFAIQRRSDRGLMGSVIRSFNDQVQETFYINEPKTIFEQQSVFNSSDVYGQPYYEIWGKHSIQGGIEKTEIIFRTMSSGGLCKAVWFRGSLEVLAFTRENQNSILMANLISDDGASMTYNLRGDSFVWKSGRPLPADDNQVRELLVEFIQHIMQYEELHQKLEGIENLYGFLTELFVYRPAEEITQIIMNGTQVSGVVGHIFAGGNIAADQNEKTKRLSRVGLMLKRAELLSADGVICELAAGMSISLLGSLELQVLERLSVPDLLDIGSRDTRWESRSSPAIKNNGTSAVLVLTDGTDDFQKFFFPGDATVHTFYRMLDSDLGGWFMDAVWTAPHHGSYTTNWGYEVTRDGAGEVVDRIDIFPFLLEMVSPRAVVITAGCNSSHGHPNFSFLGWLQQYFCSKSVTVRPHNICFNLSDTSDGEWRYTNTKYPVYTSLQYEEDWKKYIFNMTYQAHVFHMEDPCSSYRHYCRKLAEHPCLDYRQYSSQEEQEKGIVFTSGGESFVNRIPSAGLFLRRG